jgi:hypothetical protein
MPLFSGEFLNLELLEKNKTKTGSTLDVRITRKNSNYFNREGVIVTTEEFIQGSFGAPVTRTIWYTEYNPYNVTVTPASGKTINNTYNADFQYIISNESIQSGKRYGSQFIRVRLIENGTTNIIIEGTIELRTLEIALPTIAQFGVTNIGKTLLVNFFGVNPDAEYRLRINRSDSLTPILINSPLTTHNISVPITESMYRKLILFTAQWFLGSQLIIQETISIRVPNFRLGIYYKQNNEFLLIPEGNMYVKVNDAWRKVEKVYEKIGGEFISQD